MVENAGVVLLSAVRTIFTLLIQDIYPLLDLVLFKAG